MSTNSKSALVFVFSLCTLMCFGCSNGDRPELGTVKGTVTLDGKPLAGVIIVAMPEIGRPATAIVSPDGKYEFSYVEGVSGTKLGKNKVSFAWPTGASGPAIPAKYTDKSELQIDVKPGANTFDFALESDAPAAAAKSGAKAKPAPID